MIDIEKLRGHFKDFKNSGLANSKSIKDMGNIMSNLKEKYAGRCDFSIVSKLARERLI